MKSCGEYPNYWIEPNGYVHEVGMMGHCKFAFEYLEEKYGFEYWNVIRDTLNEGANGSDYLESIGWKRILTWPSGPTHFVSLPGKRWTNKQISSVVTICLDSDIDIPEQFL